MAQDKNGFGGLVDPITDTNPDSTFSSFGASTAEETYTADEKANVNNILVTVPDDRTPVVVLFGSQASGKTLAMLRLIRYLESHAYNVLPENVFRPKTDGHYARMCKELKQMAYSSYAPSGNDIISFMLVKVLDRVGNPVCQILEAPGEHYFNGSSDLTFPTYIEHIARVIPNQKIWVFFVEQDWGDTQDERNLYAQKICRMQEIVAANRKDKVIFLFNKVDKHSEQFKAGRPNKQAFFNIIRNQYPGIFTRYQNTGWFAKALWGEFNFTAICFSAGTFTNAGSAQVWNISPDYYCQDLWNAIKK